MKIHILLPVHNRREITRSFVQCLSAQTYSDYHLILIDDGSKDGTEEMVRQYVPSLTVLRGGGNLWWAGSLQRGVNWLAENRTADDALVLIINDDVHIPSNYLEQAVSVMKTKKSTLLLSRNRRSDNGEVKESGIHADLRALSFQVADVPEKINCLSTRGLFAYWKDIRHIGGFHPILLPHYLSDYEFTIRAHRKGFGCETNAVIWLESNDLTTGFHEIREISFMKYIRKYFSKRSTGNPIYWSSFILLTCRPALILPHLYRIWRNAARDLRRALRVSLTS